MTRQDSAMDSNFSAISTGPMDSHLFIGLFLSKDTADLSTEAATARASVPAFSLAKDGVSRSTPPSFFPPPGRLF